MSNTENATFLNLARPKPQFRIKVQQEPCWDLEIAKRKQKQHAVEFGLTPYNLLH